MTAPRTRLAAGLAAVGLVASFSIAAHAPDGCYVALENDPEITEDDVFACEEQHYFHRATTHASNVGQLVPEHGIATFDTTPPAGSVTGGNGGGYATHATVLVGGDEGLTDAPFTGTFTGVLDRLDIDLHQLFSSYDELNELFGGDPIHQSFDLDVEINGATVFSVAGIDIPSVPEESSDAGSTRLDVAITGLAALLDSFAFPNGPDTVHEITLTVGQGPFIDGLSVFAFDTTEVPGGIGFNRVEIPEGTLIVSAS